MCVAGAAAGAAWALIPGFLRAFARTNEIITSLMLNYVAALTLDYLIFNSHSYWRDTTSPSAAVFPQGQAIPDAATWPFATIGGVAAGSRSRSASASPSLVAVAPVGRSTGARASASSSR